MYESQIFFPVAGFTAPHESKAVVVNATTVLKVLLAVNLELSIHQRMSMQSP